LHKTSYCKTCVSLQQLQQQQRQQTLAIARPLYLDS